MEYVGRRIGIQQALVGGLVQKDDARASRGGWRRRETSWPSVQMVPRRCLRALAAGGRGHMTHNLPAGALQLKLSCELAASQARTGSGSYWSPTGLCGRLPAHTPIDNSIPASTSTGCTPYSANGWLEWAWQGTGMGGPVSIASSCWNWSQSWCGWARAGLSAKHNTRKAVPPCGATTTSTRRCIKVLQRHALLHTSCT